MPTLPTLRADCAPGVLVLAHGAAGGVSMVSIARPSEPVVRCQQSGIYLSAALVSPSLAVVGGPDGVLEFLDTTSCRVYARVSLPSAQPVIDLCVQSSAVYALTSGAVTRVLFYQGQAIVDDSQPLVADQLYCGRNMLLASRARGFAQVSIRAQTMVVSVSDDPLIQQGGAMALANDNIGAGLVRQSRLITGARASLELYNLQASQRPIPPIAGFPFDATDVTKDMVIADGLAYVAVDTLAGSAIAMVNMFSQDRNRRPPTVELMVNGNVSEVEAGSIVTVVALASDDVLVRAVELYLDDRLFGMDSSFPFEFAVLAPTAFNTSLALRARAFDLAGNAAWSAPRVVVNTLDLTPPSVLSLLPPDGTVLLGNETSISVEMSLSEEPQGSGVVASGRGSGRDGLLFTADDYLFSPNVTVVPVLQKIFLQIALPGNSSLHAHYYLAVSNVRDLTGNQGGLAWFYHVGSQAVQAAVWLPVGGVVAGITAPFRGAPAVFAVSGAGAVAGQQLSVVCVSAVAATGINVTLLVNGSIAGLANASVLCQPGGSIELAVVLPANLTDADSVLLTVATANNASSAREFLLGLGHSWFNNVRDGRTALSSRPPPLLEPDAEAYVIMDTPLADAVQSLGEWAMDDLALLSFDGLAVERASVEVYTVSSPVGPRPNLTLVRQLQVPATLPVQMRVLVPQSGLLWLRIRAWNRPADTGYPGQRGAMTVRLNKIARSSFQPVPFHTELPISLDMPGKCRVLEFVTNASRISVVPVRVMYDQAFADDRQQVMIVSVFQPGGRLDGTPIRTASVGGYVNGATEYYYSLFSLPVSAGTYRLLICTAYYWQTGRITLLLADPTRIEAPSFNLTHGLSVSGTSYGWSSRYEAYTGFNGVLRFVNASAGGAIVQVQGCSANRYRCGVAVYSDAALANYITPLYLDPYQQSAVVQVPASGVIFVRILQQQYLVRTQLPNRSAIDQAATDYTLAVTFLFSDPAQPLAFGQQVQAVQSRNGLRLFNVSISAAQAVRPLFAVATNDMVLIPLYQSSGGPVRALSMSSSGTGGIVTQAPGAEGSLLLVVSGQYGAATSFALNVYVNTTLGPVLPALPTDVQASGAWYPMAADWSHHEVLVLDCSPGLEVQITTLLTPAPGWPTSVQPYSQAVFRPFSGNTSLFQYLPYGFSTVLMRCTSTKLVGYLQRDYPTWTTDYQVG
jgi:hypothetical protein